MKRCFFLIGYWLVHTGGVFPITLKSPEKNQKKKNKAHVSFDGRRTPWKPWRCSRRGIFLGIGHIIMILYNSAQFLTEHCGDLDIFNWDLKTVSESMIRVMTMAKATAMVCCVLTTVIRHQKMEQLANNVCSLYFNVLKSTDPPELRKFAFLIIYFIFSVVATVLIGILPSYSTPGYLQIFVWQVPYMFITTHIEATSGVILIYLQSAIEGLNHEIKSWFPRVDEFGLKTWEPVLFRGKNHHEPQGLRKNAKNLLAKYRRTYRSVIRIVDRLNSVYGFLMLIIVIFGQIACLFSAFCYLIQLRNWMSKFEKVDHRIFIFGFTCVWSFVRTSMICRRYEIVVKEIRRHEFSRPPDSSEMQNNYDFNYLSQMTPQSRKVQVTIRYLASIDASEIDHDSKIELLEFLDEIDGGNIRFTASNIFSLNYSTLYSMLTNTITYIVIVMQHLSG